MTSLPFPMDAAELAAAIDVPLEKWPGDCHGVACAVRDLVPVEGMRLARGHWEGFVSRSSVYRTSGPVQHSWLVAPDGRVLDPTRWALVSPSRPEIYLGVNDCYDEGARRIAASMPPSFPGAPDMWADVVERLSPEAGAELAELLGGTPGDVRGLAWKLRTAITDDPSRVPAAREVYALLAAEGRKAVVPIDSWMRVMEPGKLACRTGSNRVFSLPEAPARADLEILSMVFSRFLSVEERDGLEEELEELGYDLERDLWKSLNVIEAMKEDPVRFVPREVASTLSVIAGDLLGRGFGEELRVERFVASLGVDPARFDAMLREFGERGGCSLGWDVPGAVSPAPAP